MRKLFAVVALLLAFALPTAQGQQPQKVVGKWQMVWDGDSCRAEFLADGTYWCDWVDGRRWAGTWSMVDDRLAVEEGPAGVVVERWAVTLTAGSLGGVLDRGGDFSLKP